MGQSKSANHIWSASILKMNNGSTYTKEIYDELKVSIGSFQQKKYEKLQKRDDLIKKGRKKIFIKIK